MDGNDSRIPDGWEGQIKRTEENFKTISELKEKLEILTEHVESRKAALEDVQRIAEALAGGNGVGSVIGEFVERIENTGDATLCQRAVRFR